MSATELDLPVLISGDQIRRREFVTIRRGYDPDQVRDYLDQLADQVEQMEALVREARMEAGAALRAQATPRIDPYEELATRVASVIRSADESAERIRLDARSDAEREVQEARSDADRIRTDAQASAEEARTAAERTLSEARERADRTIAGLSTRRDTLLDQLSGMQERLLTVASELERTIEVRGEDVAEETQDLESTTTSPPAAWAPGERTIVIGEAPGSPDRAAPSSPWSMPAMQPPLDPSYEELWEGTEAMQLEVPEIPMFDLNWDDDEDAATGD